MIQKTPGQPDEPHAAESEVPNLGAQETCVEGVTLRDGGLKEGGVGDAVAIADDAVIAGDEQFVEQSSDSSESGQLASEERSPAEESSEEAPNEAPEEAVSPEEREESIALLVPQLEAILFVAREPIRTERFVATLGAPKADVGAALQQVSERFSGERSGVHLVEIAGGWRFLSNPAFADTLAVLHGAKAADRLSPAAMETLAIIAYKQPAARAEIERIRGVGVGPIVRLLLELELVRVAGRDEGLGRALMYGTTKSFLDRFGLGSIRDLPAGLEG